MLKTDSISEDWGEVGYGYREVSHSVSGVNMQDVNTLQKRLRNMSPLDTDLCSLSFLGGGDLFGRSVSHTTSYFRKTAESERSGWRTTRSDTQANRRAERRS